MKTRMGTGCSSATFRGSKSTKSNYSSSIHAYDTIYADFVSNFLESFRMFVGSCKRLRIMKGTEAKGLG